MFFMKWRATEMKMYKIMHFVKKVEHILPALDVTARMKWMNATDENAEIFEEQSPFCRTSLSGTSS